MDETVNQVQNMSSEKKTSASRNIFDLLETLVWMLCIVLFITTFLFKQAVVNQTSMINTLANGDRLIISNLFYTPKNGDIVVFQGTDDKALVKRIIAIGGQTVSSKNGVVYVDGVRLDENYVYIDYPDSHADFIVSVPENMIFVMGDHRNNSKDSRDFGCISEDSIIGHVLFRITPFYKFGTVK